MPAADCRILPVPPPCSVYGFVGRWRNETACPGPPAEKDQVFVRGE